MPSAQMEGRAGRQAALDALRAAMLRGDVVPGQRLVEAELAETFGVTRTSMRAALIELTAAGLVERIPHQFHLAVRPGRMHTSLPEHLEIIEAITGRDPAAAEAAARAHLHSVITALREPER